MHNVLKSLLTQAINPVYLQLLHLPDSGLSKIHLCNILTFLFDEYGEIPPQALNDNDRKFHNDRDPNSPMTMLIDQIKTCIEFATDGIDPYPESTILNNAYNLVYKSGLFFND